MDGLNKALWLSGVDILGDTVSQIKHMPAAGAKTSQNSIYLTFNNCRRSIKCGGIHIPLQRDTITHSPPCIANFNRPIQTYGITTSIGDVLEPLTTIFSEQGHWNALPIMFTN